MHLRTDNFLSFPTLPGLRTQALSKRIEENKSPAIPIVARDTGTKREVAPYGPTHYIVL